jgi:soluble lytic murein transglycosylase-like protein
MMVAVTANKLGALCLLALISALVPPATASEAPRKVVIKANKKTGRLERVTVIAPKITIVPPSAEIAALVDDAARRNAIDPLLVQSVIQVESNYNPYAVSTAGARGLMQLMPGTARDLGVTNTFDPRQNIEAGVKYLKYLKDLYQDDRLALAAYNAGPGAVQKYRREVPPYPETQDYVQRVGERYEARKAAAIAPAVAPIPEPQPEPQAPAVIVTEETHPRLEQYVDEYGRWHLRTAP